MNRIFVTGAPRSGTTFVGLVLSKGMDIDLIHEPFNPDCGVRSISQRYLYLRPKTARAEEVKRDIEDLLNYRAHLRTGYYTDDSHFERIAKGVLGSRGGLYYRIAKFNPFAKHVVIKDPIGILMTGYLAENFGFKPVILVRHPVAFVASMIRLSNRREWNHDLSFVPAQPDLVEDFFCEDLDKIARAGENQIDRAAMLWKLLNQVVLAQADASGTWMATTHEEISANPVESFQNICEYAGLPWTKRKKQVVIKRTSSRNETEARGKRVQQFNRNSKELFELRRNMIDKVDRARIFEITQDIALRFYSEASFSI